LKQDDRPFLEKLVAFVTQRAGSSPQVMISSRDAQTMLYLHRRLPHVQLLLTLANPGAVAKLRGDPALQRAIGGVSAFEGLVDANLVQWAHGLNLKVVAWTVTDGIQLNELVRLGVDGITTPNLAILRALS